jgi:hypothetical protein
LKSFIVKQDMAYKNQFVWKLEWCVQFTNWRVECELSHLLQIICHGQIVSVVYVSWGCFWNCSNVQQSYIMVIWRQNASGDGRFQKLMGLVFVYAAH